MLLDAMRRRGVTAATQCAPLLLLQVVLA